MLLSLFHNVPHNSYLYMTAMDDRSMRILSVDKHECIATVYNIHDTPVTCACWFNRSTLYLTGCRLVALLYMHMIYITTVLTISNIDNNTTLVCI